MSRDKRLNRTQEVDGSIPFGSTKSSNKLREKSALRRSFRTGECTTAAIVQAKKVTIGRRQQLQNHTCGQTSKAGRVKSFTSQIPAETLTPSARAQRMW
jgi:hypothetical protein